ncbi:hypothetical protein CHS0354_021409 [Potamilus streckersoni]|uniref:Uncharacterized protein n=1 Tax=Potamilus streckersoni TaxID=2493646 RepID=A0AAE0S224_9BIVA|nr:hypothetical protein CHS0354_021409 [Potamilus streckersoni]
MILSTVNFVAKSRSGKYPGGKLKDGQKNVSKEVNVPSVPQCEKYIKQQEAECQLSRRETTESNRTSGYISDSSFSSEESGISDLEDKCPRVTIETVDKLFLSVDPTYYHICLRGLESSNSSCIFRSKVLKREEFPNGTKQHIVFFLDCDPEFYLTTTKDRQLEINMFQDKDVSIENPDERMFILYEPNPGCVIIQPHAHNGYYLHHIDDNLDVYKFDLNARAPEEFFFSVSSVSPTNVQQETELATQNTCQSEKRCRNCHMCDAHNRNTLIPDASGVKKSYKKSLAELFFGCVSNKRENASDIHVQCEVTR